MISKCPCLQWTWYPLNLEICASCLYVQPESVSLYLSCKVQHLWTLRHKVTSAGWKSKTCFWTTLMTVFLLWQTTKQLKKVECETLHVHVAASQLWRDQTHTHTHFSWFIHYFDVKTQLCFCTILILRPTKYKTPLSHDQDMIHTNDKMFPWVSKYSSELVWKHYGTKFNISCTRLNSHKVMKKKASFPFDVSNVSHSSRRRRI